MPIHARLYPLVDDAWPTWRPLWQRLLDSSTNPSPFLDWDWLQLWWKHFEARDGESAHLCIAYDGDTPLGALPVIVGPVRRSRLLELTSVQVMGNRLYDRRNIFSEYLDVIAVPGREQDARSTIVDALRSRFRAGEFVVGWTRQVAPWIQKLSTPGSHVRIASQERSYQADLSAGFASYVAGLGASTRRSMVNLRSRLERDGPLRFVEEESTEQALRALERLNQLHAGRWGKPAFAGRGLAFHRALISAWMPRGRVVFTSLFAGERCISSCYDLRINARQYNIQMGFDAHFAPRTSLGLIHLGYAMERAAARGVTVYDFLAGKGRKSDYKRHLATISQEVCTIQALHGPLVTRLYRLVDVVRRGARPRASGQHRA